MFNLALLSCGWSHLVNKLSSTRSLNLFVSKANNQNNQILLNSYTPVNDQTLMIVWRFPVILEIAMCSAVLIKKGVMYLLSNLAVTKCTSIINVRADFFLQGIFTMDSKLNLHGDQKITSSLQIIKLLSIDLPKWVLSCGDFFPIKRRAQISSFLEAFRITFLLIKTSSDYFLIHTPKKLLA